MAKSKVFLTNPVQLNLTPAMRFGRIVLINNDYVYGDELWPEDRLPKEISTNLSVSAALFSPSHDYLLLAGDHLQIVHMSAMIQSLHGRFRVLRWDRIAEGYVSCWVGCPLVD